MESPHEQELSLARRHLQGQRVDEAKRILSVLANQNYAPVMYDLAHVLLIEATDSDPNGRAHQNRIRTSHDFLFLPQSETLTLKLLQMRMAAFVGLPLKNAEAMVLLRYAPGQEYLPHRDYLPPSHFTAIKDGGGGQRLSTVISYLNTPAEGGDTTFPMLNVQIPAVRGRVLRFDNIQPDQHLNTLSLHAGTPVKQGFKWISTL